MGGAGVAVTTSTTLGGAGVAVTTVGGRWCSGHNCGGAGVAVTTVGALV